MPVKSLNSAVLAWPDARRVDAGLRAWAAACAEAHPELDAVGYFGSYATGKWGVGSDLDVVLLLSECRTPFEKRAMHFDTSGMAVPVDLLVYTEAEWVAMDRRGDRFRQDIARQAVWVFRRQAENKGRAS